VAARVMRTRAEGFMAVILPQSRTICPMRQSAGLQRLN
jgi:hypothetical protein